MLDHKGVCFFSIGMLLIANLSFGTNTEQPIILSILNEARALRVTGDVYKAEALLTRAQRISPRSADVYLEMAYLRKAQGDYTGLREVVDFGADIATGPPASIAQLRILRDKLTVLLPLDSETPFQLPPAVAIKSESIPEEMSGQSGAIKPPSDTQPEKLSADSAADKNSVRVSDKSSVTTQSSNRKKEVQLQNNRKIANVQRSDASQGPRLVESDSDKSEQSDVTVARVLRHRPSESLENTGSLVTSEKISSPPAANSASTQFFGAGILARPQLGSWISRGTIERDY